MKYYTHKNHPKSPFLSAGNKKYIISYNDEEDIFKIHLDNGDIEIVIDEERITLFKKLIKTQWVEYDFCFYKKPENMDIRATFHVFDTGNEFKTVLGFIDIIKGNDNIRFTKKEWEEFSKRFYSIQESLKQHE